MLAFIVLEILRFEMFDLERPMPAKTSDDNAKAKALGSLQNVNCYNSIS